MLKCSTFYDIIGKDNFNILLEKKILPNRSNFTIENFEFHESPKYKDIITILKMNEKNKLIEFLVCEYIKKYGVFNTEKQSKMDDYICINSISSSKVKYDLLYKDILVDIKCYKKEFTDSQFNKFILQLALYYIYIMMELSKLYSSNISVYKIKYIVILNPITGKLYKCNTNLIHTHELVSITEKYNISLKNCFENIKKTEDIVKQQIDNKPTENTKKDDNKLIVTQFKPIEINKEIESKHIENINNSKSIENIKKDDSKLIVNPKTGKYINIDGKVYKDLIYEGYKYNSQKHTLEIDMVMNPVTKKSIKVNGSVFNKLIKEGYKYDIQKKVLYK